MARHLRDESDRLKVEPGRAFRLADRDPDDISSLPGKARAAAELAGHAKAIDALQDRLYAEGRRALLVVLQGTDTSGKDGTIRGVFAETTPLGVGVTPFKVPSAEEIAHDFLWRIHKACPARGTIGIFNRSQYEDVLAGRVRKLAQADEIERRYDEINAFERHLVANGTTVIKFMLHISKDEQKKRLQARLDDVEKHWKFSPSDLADRKLWRDFQAAYQVALQRCSTPWAPWYVIPANHKWARNLYVARIVRATLEALDPRPAEPAWNAKDITIR